MATVTLDPRTIGRAFADASSTEQAEILRHMFDSLSQYPMQMEYVASALEQDDYKPTRETMAYLLAPLETE